MSPAARARLRWGLASALLVGCAGGHVDGPASTGAAAGGGAGAGAAGTTGAAGLAGTTGAAGLTGTAGVAGSTGAAGVVGSGGASAGTTGAGGVVDGGTSDAGSIDARPDAPASCAALVCEDFEQLAVGAKPGAPFTVRASKGTVLVDDTRAHGGSHAVKVSVTATTTSDAYRQAYLSVTGAPLIPLPNNHVYGRFFIYTDRIPDKTVHWTIAHGDGPLGTLTGTYNYGGMGGLMANYYRNTTPDPTDCWQTKNASFPTGRWVCVAFEFDGPGNAMRFSLDGADVPELDVMGLAKTDATCTVKGVDGRWLAPTFKNINIGWESYQHDALGAHDAWIDDLALDTHPIGCP